MCEFIGYTRALDLATRHLTVLDAETVPLAACADRVLATDLNAKVSSPTTASALVDGYAVRTRDLVSAGPRTPVDLQVVGTIVAGLQQPGTLIPKTTIRIMTGAGVPDGADAVVANERVRCMGERIRLKRPLEAGRNILPAGADITKGNLIAASGERLSPGRIGLLAAAGFDHLPVVKRPRIGIIACGDEVVEPGRPLPDGKLYASNLAALRAWCHRYGMAVHTAVVADRSAIIRRVLEDAVRDQDAVLTSGGAWSGDRDLVLSVLRAMQWRPVFSRIRMAPGKGVSVGCVGSVPVFVLPGGPTGNFAAFCTIALPALMRLAGYRQTGLPSVGAVLESDLCGRQREWTQVVFGRLKGIAGERVFAPLHLASRLQSIAAADALATIPEGTERLAAGSRVRAWWLR